MAPQRRVVVGGPANSGSTDDLALDDQPLEITLSADARHLIITLPYELWIVAAKSLTVQRTVALGMARPSVCEGWEGTLWIGGQHLHRGKTSAATAAKVGTKLGGYVDHLCMVREDLLCGVGSQGEILWDIDRSGPVHKHKSSGPDATGVVASADGRAVFMDGTSTCWVLDPTHPEGYAQLRLIQTSAVAVEGEAIVRLGSSVGGPTGRGSGRVLLGALDGAIAWTSQDLRLAGERIPAGSGKRDVTPLALCADDRWVYVLRPRGVLQRFLVAQPKPPKSSKSSGRVGKKGRSMSGHQTGGEPEPEPLPEAQQVRLSKRASCMTLIVDESKRSLVLGGGRADGELGRLWQLDPESLEWETLALSERQLVEPPPPPDPDAEPVPAQRPSFIATKNKLAGPKISKLPVDAIVGAKVDHWLTHGAGTLLDRPTEIRSIEDTLPGDAILLPAMVRFAEGTARPALLLWPGVVEDHPRAAPAPSFLVWGDEPRAWMPLDTPEIRAQRWSRTDVFPLQVAVAKLPEGAPGKRQELDPKWIDQAHFEVLAKECKRMLKVLW